MDLPGFFQEDNVRQHWRILTWFVEEGYVWKSVRAAEVAESELLPPRPDDWPDVLENVAEAEYERWRDLRVRRGWWTGPRHDAGRLNPELPGWESANQGYNVQQVQRILDRLWATGLSPERLSQTEPQSPPDGR